MPVHVIRSIMNRFLGRSASSEEAEEPRQGLINDDGRVD